MEIYTININSGIPIITTEMMYIRMLNEVKLAFCMNWGDMVLIRGLSFCI